MLVNLDNPKNYQCEELSFMSISSDTQSLIRYDFPYLIMNIPEPVCTMSDDSDKEFQYKIIFDKSEKTEASPYQTAVFIETEKDGDGYCAYSEKYHNILAYGKTENDAIDTFIKLFTDKTYGEQLSNYYFSHQLLSEEKISFKELIGLIKEYKIKYTYDEKRNMVIIYCKDQNNLRIMASDIAFTGIFKRAIKVIKDWFKELTDGRS